VRRNEQENAATIEQETTMKKKKYWEMNADELQDATKQYDHEFVAMDEIRPMTKTARAIQARALKKGRLGRPQVGEGSDRINVTIERGLLNRADAFARSHNLTRAKLIAMGLESAMKIGSKTPKRRKIA
jgi:hypothetical protein